MKTFCDVSKRKITLEKMSLRRFTSRKKNKLEATHEAIES